MISVSYPILKKEPLGFTLIEVVIVIAIIGVLSTVAVPAYLDYLARSKVNTCLYEAKGYSNEVYYLINDQNDNSVPEAPFITSCRSITDASGWITSKNRSILATVGDSSNTRIICNLSEGTPCRII